MNKIDISQKIAIITGGAKGIGWAIAERFVASGAQLVIFDQDQAANAKAARQPAMAQARFETVDVRDYAQVERAVKSTASAFGRIDILVCSAGIAGPNHPLAEYPLDKWREIMAINLDGVFHCNRAVVPFMQKNQYGRIVNIASIAGKEGNPNASAYSASKAGVISITKSLGKELATFDIGVNCITPAIAKTAILEQTSPEHTEYMLSKIPRGKFVQVEEIAAMTAWLCSAENSCTTGGVFDISGGRATY